MGSKCGVTAIMTAGMFGRYEQTRDGKAVVPSNRR